MEQLKKIYGQLRDLFLSMTPGNRIIASLLVAVLVVSLGYLLVGSVKTGTSESKYTKLYNGRQFDNAEQRGITEALSRQSLSDYQWVGGGQIQVPTKLVPKYTAAIADGKAVRDRGTAMMETAQGLGAWESAKMMDEKTRVARAKVAEDSIAELEEVASASVIPNLRTEWDRSVWAKRQIYSVAVNVKSKLFKPLSDNTVAAIASIVGPAFGITDYREIRIVDTENTRSYNGLGEEQVGGGTSYLKEQARYQEIWKDKIYKILPHIRGLQVETSVELTKYRLENMFEVQHDKPKAPLHEHVKGTDFLKEDASHFGRPGQIAQMSRPLIDPTVGMADRAKTTEKTHESEITNPLAGRETKTELIPFVPLRIMASLQIPRDYVRDNWIRKNSRQGETPPAPTPEQLGTEEITIRDEAKRIVAKLLELYRDPKAPDPLDMVEVSFYDPLVVPETILSSWDQFQIWLAANWQTLGLMGLVLCGLAVLWGITRPAKPDQIVIHEAPEIPLEVIEARAKAEAEAVAEAQAAEEDLDEDGHPRTLDSFDKSIRSLQDEIAELVAENPDLAAAVLRQWIGNVVQIEK